MHIRRLTAVSVLAAMGTLAGCGAEDPGEPTAGDDTAYRETPADQAPAPESTVPGTEPTTDQGLAGRDQPTTDPADRPTGQVGTDPGTAGAQAGMTEFVALDTNSDGMLGEDEWQPEAVDGMEFAEIDQDSSGDVDREEFRQALTMSQTGQSQPGTTGMTEFAALDTNSDGRLGEDEWQPDAVDGMEFEEIDEDSSGDIDREEFRQALSMSQEGQTTLPDEDALDPTTP
jgi:Ca2+-binding EF-hand superfamily protein